MELEMEVILKDATNALHCFIVVCCGLHVTFVPIRLHNMVANREQLVPQIGSVSPMFFAVMVRIWFVESATEQNDTLRQNVLESYYDQRQQSCLRCRSNSNRGMLPSGKSVARHNEHPQQSERHHQENNLPSMERFINYTIIWEKAW